MDSRLYIFKYHYLHVRTSWLRRLFWNLDFNCLPSYEQNDRHRSDNQIRQLFDVISAMSLALISIWENNFMGEFTTNKSLRAEFELEITFEIHQWMWCNWFWGETDTSMSFKVSQRISVFLQFGIFMPSLVLWREYIDCFDGFGPAWWAKTIQEAYNMYNQVARSCKDEKLQLKPGHFGLLFCLGTKSFKCWPTCLASFVPNGRCSSPKQWRFTS